MRGERIQARLGAGEAGPEGTRVVDLGGSLLAPGLLDLHVHGSFVFAEPERMAEALERDARTAARHGVTGFLPTTVAWGHDALAFAMTRLTPVMTRSTPAGARILGIHLEGPWIRPEASGAQPARDIRPYDRAEGRDSLDRGEGWVRLVTLAPEVPGAPELLEELTRRGIVASLGHTLATPEQIDAAVTQGARHATHLFNAMGPLHQRGPGTAAAILAHDGLGCDLICDGAHVHRDWVRVTARVKGTGLVLISDRVEPGGSPHDADDARVGFGSGKLLGDGEAWRLPDGLLAGSRLTMDRAMANVTRWGAMTRCEAVAACTLRPARLLGLETEIGTLRPGARADFVVLAPDGSVLETWVGGRRAHPSV